MALVTVSLREEQSFEDDVAAVPLFECSYLYTGIVSSWSFDE